MNGMTRIKVSKRTGRISHGIGDLVVLKPESGSARLFCRPWGWVRGFVFAKKQRGPVFDLQGKPVAGSRVDRLTVHAPEEKDPTTNWFYLDEATIPLADVVSDPFEAAAVLEKAYEAAPRGSSEERCLFLALRHLQAEALESVQ